MRITSFILVSFLTLAACEGGSSVNVSQLEHDPRKKSVNIDDHRIYVVPTGAKTYTAWGGANDRDGMVQYRQRRGIEIISGCRVTKLLTKKTDDVLQATVKC